MTPAPDGWDAPNELHHGSPPTATWTTVNAAEAIPGVVTPLAWSILGPTTDASFRHAFRTIGALTAHEALPPADPGLRVGALHYGQFALRLDLICCWANRIPGTNGAAMGRQVFGRVPEHVIDDQQWRHYPRVARRVHTPFLRYPKRVLADRRRVEPLWVAAIQRLPELDADGSRALLAQGAREFTASTMNHVTLVLGAVQPAYELLQRACAGTDVTAQELMIGHGGHAESDLLSDLWGCAQGTMSLDAFLLRHGYHGPNEGDLASRVWREDTRPVLKLVDAYRERGPEAEPGRGEEERKRQRRARERDLLGARGPAGRLPIEIALRIAARYLPLRGLGKATFLQALDICRASARRLGVLLAQDGTFDHPDDVFFLRLEELTAPDPTEFTERIAARRALHEHYRTLQLPESWVGCVQPPAAPELVRSAELSGVGASPGVVTGAVRVVTDPFESAVDEGEILVARTTDPSWAPLMFLSAGLIAEIGGVMSHTAVVARELGIPCVVNATSAVQALKTGDVVRMDGTTGSIRVVERSPAAGYISG